MNFLSAWEVMETIPMGKIPTPWKYLPKLQNINIKKFGRQQVTFSFRNNSYSSNKEMHQILWLFHTSSLCWCFSHHSFIFLVPHRRPPPLIPFTPQHNVSCFVSLNIQDQQPKKSSPSFYHSLKKSKSIESPNPITTRSMSAKPDVGSSSAQGRKSNNEKAAWRNSVKPCIWITKQLKDFFKGLKKKTVCQNLDLLKGASWSRLEKPSLPRLLTGFFLNTKRWRWPHGKFRELELNWKKVTQKEDQDRKPRCTTVYLRKQA